MKKRNRNYIVTSIALIVLVFVGLLLAKKKYTEIDLTTYTTEYVTVLELISEMQFDVYAEENWTNFFADDLQKTVDITVVEQLLNRLGIAEYVNISDISKQDMLTRDEWNFIYEQILDFLDMKQEVAQTQVLILDTMGAEEKTVLITNHGDYYTNLPVEWFEKWKAYNVYTKGEQCLGISSLLKDDAVIANAYLKTIEDDQITFLFDGAVYEKEIGKLEAVPVVGVCDLIIASERVKTIRTKQDRIEGNLLSYSETEIEIEEYGKIHHENKLPVYQIYGDVVEKSISDVVLGNMKAEYVTGENQVCAILITKPADIENIRVLLLGDDGGKFRTDIYLKSDVPATLCCGEQNETIAAGTVIHPTEYVTADLQNTFVMTPTVEEGLIYICDEQGMNLSNGYAGSMEMRYQEEGYTLVNQLPLEKYLCAVVPSEMPSSYAPEALKAQAICARSYAYIQLLRADLARYGAHINDSTSYQVYNKVAATEESRAAVYNTAGMVLTYQGSPIEAYYFSTSMGFTDTAEIWNVEDLSAYGYLKSACLNTVPEEKDLSQEDAFLAYISEKPEGYDSEIKFYRWNAYADYRDKTDEINDILKSRKAVSPKNILYFEKDGSTNWDESEAGDIEKMGDLQEISVLERSKAGSILTLKLVYESGMVHVKTEYNIRKVLGCGLQKIVFSDGSENAESRMLPSAFCALTLQTDNTMQLSGGGYGHGLGMSQNAANGMAKAGMHCEEILQYFYKDIKIEPMTQ